MIFAGCDLGTSAAKLVILEDRSIMAAEILSYATLPTQAAVDVLERALCSAGLSIEALDGCVATGFGKKAVPYAGRDAPEALCLARAIRHLTPGVRTVIDAGGQTIRAHNIGKNGKVIDTAANEKCAAGTGRFIEVMAKALEIELGQLGQLSSRSKNPVTITSQCGVFAESEVITHVNDGRDRADIVAGIHRSVASKIASLVRRLDLAEQVAMVGGVAKNSGVVACLERELGLGLAELPVDPQIFTALGAALVAEERHAG